MFIERFLLICVCTFPLLYGGNTWTETSQSDFADGVYDCNIFSSGYDGGTILFTTPYDYNQDGYLDIVVSNEMSQASYVYWGNSSGYSASNKTSYPGNSKGDWEAGDVNNDGFPELLSAQGDNYLIRIFCGSATGPNPNSYIDVPLGNWNESCLLADLNRDGFLDLIVQKYCSGNGAIFWGRAAGYSTGNMTLLPATAGEHNIEVADFNRDGFLDLLFIREENNTKSYVFWGGAEGFNPANHAAMANPPGLPSGSSIADLNNDGYLDIVLTSFCGGEAAYVYTGSANGFTLWKSLLAGSCFGGSSIADFNRDGYLDIIFTRGYGICIQPVIYWGGAGGYSEVNKTFAGPSVDASGALVADFNGDGNLDIFVHNYAYPPQGSYFLYGPDFSTAVNPLPTSRDAHAIFREIGNVYTRKYEEPYLSSIFDAGSRANWGYASWTAALPAGSSILISFRGGNTPIPDNFWTGWSEVSNGGFLPADLNSRYLQYAALFTYITPAHLPMLKDISVTYDPLDILAASIVIKPEVINLKSHGVFTGFITLPSGYDPGNIDINSLQCNGAHAVNGEVTPNNFIAKFNVQDLVGVAPGDKVAFVLTGQLKDGTPFGGCDTIRVIDKDYICVDCAPNPFHGRTVLTISKQSENPLQPGDINIKIYDQKGALVRSINGIPVSGGKTSVTWDRQDNMGRKVAAGVYLLRVDHGSSSVTEKLVILD